MGVRYRLTITLVKGLTEASQPKTTSHQVVTTNGLIETKEIASRIKRYGRNKELAVLLRVWVTMSIFSAKEAEADWINGTVWIAKVSVSAAVMR